jgi:integrase/recombinase XerD
VAEDPLQDIPFLKEDIIVPFVFSPEHVDQVLRAVCKGIRRTETFFLTDYGVFTAALLMARCGMRISEPLRHHYSPEAHE